MIVPDRSVRYICRVGRRPTILFSLPIALGVFFVGWAEGLPFFILYRLFRKAGRPASNYAPDLSWDDQQIGHFHESDIKDGELSTHTTTGKFGTIRIYLPDHVINILLLLNISLI
jgi:hypothetical protein